MTSWTLIKRSLLFYRRGHLGVAAGAAVGAAVLVGALVVGDSINHSLKSIAESRLGNVALAAGGPERFFRAELADEMADALGATAAPALRLNGAAFGPEGDGGERANQVQVLGVDRRFWSLGGGPVLLEGGAGREVVLNGRLAERLNAREGDIIVLNVRRPGLLPADAPMSPEKHSPATLELRVKAIASESDFGRFSLRAEQVAPFNAFVPLSLLQEAIGRPGRANMLLIGGPNGADITPDAAAEALRRCWKLADADLELRELPEQGVVELRTDRVFLERPVEQAAKRAFPNAVGVLTYFVNEIRCGGRSTPYSMVTAIGPLNGRQEAQPSPRDKFEWLGLESLGLSGEMRDNEIVINEWLAEKDLQAGVGDEIELEYFVIAPMRRLLTRTSRFRVRRIVPLAGLAADRELMPSFPGVIGVDDCRRWKPGVDFHPRRIKKKDQDYWDRYRGAPKAFVTLPAGRRMWRNRFGSLTAVRFPLTTGAAGRIDEALRREIDPASVGLFFRPVRAEAAAAGAGALDFGRLFLGMSSFLIVSAVLLVGLLFVFGVQQRTEQVGVLLALGFRPGRVRRILLIEGGAVALIGGAVGTFGGLLYTRAVLYGLRTVWSGAMAGPSTIRFHAEPLTLVAGGACGVLAAVAAMWIILRRQTGAPPRELLAAGVGPGSFFPASSGPRRRSGLWIGLAAVAAAVIIVSAAGAGADRAAGAAFFAAGTALLAGALAFSHAIISAFDRPMHAGGMTLTGLALRNSARRIWRSLATVALLACGCFLIIAVGANRKDPTANPADRRSGTGGFSLWGESALPVLHDLNDPEDARRVYGLNPAETKGVEFVQLRVHEGDDASCLNLNRPRRPRLMGVRPEQLHRRGSFTFARLAEQTPSPWLLLDRRSADGAVPAVGDHATVVWALGKSVGDTFDYTDERGRTFKIRIVGSLAGSILQGSLLISERNFIERFGSESGYRAFLIDAPPEKTGSLTAALTHAPRLRDAGLELTPATERLAAFYAVESTYLSIFQALGSLGLLLGSAGLGVVVLRNVLERRGELALLRAVGLTRRRLWWLVLCEHWALLVMGLACGSAAAVVAVMPALLSAGMAVPYASLGATLAVVAAAGVAWTSAAGVAALRGPMLPALRGE